MNELSIFNYLDYKKFVNEWIKTQKSGGHGQLRKMSLYLEVNSVVMTQVFRGDRDLSLEQALKLSGFLGFNENERKFFLLLVQKDRAGTHELKIFFEKQIRKLQEKALQLKNRIDHEKLSDESKARFYSHWLYSGVRQSFSLESIKTTEDVAERFKLKQETVAKIVEFLLSKNLLIKNGVKITSGPQVTHVGADSSFVSSHHKNWRLKAIDTMGTYEPKNFHYTGPMSLSVDVAQEIHDTLMSLIKNATSKVTKSDSETLRCLNIDWFEY